MNPTDKMHLKAQISAISAQNMAFKAQIGIPPAPVIGGVPPMPIVLAPAFAQWTQALQMQADSMERMLKLLEDIIAKS